MTLKTVLLVTAFLALPMRILAGVTGILEGTVKDGKTGEPLVGVNVLILGTRQGAATDRTGYFQVNNVPAGSYDVRFSLIGYQTVIHKGVEIVPDLRTKMKIEMTESAIELEAVEVVAEKPILQKDVTATVHRVTGRKIEMLPITSVQDVIRLQPGVTVEGNVRGGKTTEVIYFVDGLPIQDVVGGGPGSELPKSSIVEMSIQTGGFDAEYGNALSAVVNLVTRSGGDNHQFLVRADNDYFYGGSQNNKMTEVEAAASGPVVRERLYYFLSTDFLLSGTRWWQDFQRFFGMPISRDHTGFGKLQYHFSPTHRLSAQVLYSARRWRDYEFSWRFNLDGLPERRKDSYRAALIWSHTLSANSFYTLSLSNYWIRSRMGPHDKSAVDTTVYQYDFFLQYVFSGSRAWWTDSRQSIYTLKGDFTTQLSSKHLVKTGFELNQYALDTDILKLEPQRTFFGKILVDRPLLDFSTQYRYFPRSGSAFIQDKIELEKDGAFVNLGVRFDFLDPRAERPQVEFVPVSEGEYTQQVVQSVRAAVKSRFSPRFGISAPVGERWYLFINYGEYFQFPLFQYLYSGLDPVRLRSGVRAVFGNPNLEPEHTRSWELSVKHLLTSEVLASLSYFRKETTNQIDAKTFVPSNSRIAGDYGFAEYVNNPHAEASGFELQVTRNRGAYVTGSISYAYTTAKGLSEYANQTLNYAQWGFPLYPVPFYLSWDVRHSVKLDLEVALPWDLSGNFIVLYNSAKPYTSYPSRDGFTSDEPNRPFIPNNARMKDYTNIDLKLSKRLPVRLFGAGGMTMYVDVRNLQNRRNVMWMDSSGRIGGELGDPSASYSWRRTRVGMRVDF